MWTRNDGLLLPPGGQSALGISDSLHRQGSSRSLTIERSRHYLSPFIAYFGTIYQHLSTYIATRYHLSHLVLIESTVGFATILPQLVAM
jgi:hypothetical protein